MVTSKEVMKYNPSKRLCYFSSERRLQFFKIYTPDNCRLECSTNRTVEKCGCANFHMPSELVKKGKTLLNDSISKCVNSRVTKNMTEIPRDRENPVEQMQIKNN